MSRVIVGRGKNRATIEGPDAQELEALVREALGDAVNVLDDAVEEVFTEVKKTWPVFSGKSLNAWEKVMVIDPASQTVRVSLLNREKYVLYVKSGKSGKTQSGRVRSPVVTDVRQPMQAKRKALSAPLKAALIAALGRTFNG